MHGESRNGWVELLTRNDWELVRGRGGFIVISDRVNDRAEGGPKYHDRACDFVTLTNFIAKVSDVVAAGQRPNGQYFWVASEDIARAGGARRCEHPSDPVSG